MPADDRNLLFWTGRLFGLPINDLLEAVEFVIPRRRVCAACGEVLDAFSAHLLVPTHRAR